MTGMKLRVISYVNYYETSIRRQSSIVRQFMKEITGISILGSDPRCYYNAVTLRFINDELLSDHVKLSDVK